MASAIWPTSFDQRQWQFLLTEVQASFAGRTERFLAVKKVVERVFDLTLRRQMPIPTEADSIGSLIKRVGNAEEAVICVLDALRRSELMLAADGLIAVDWPGRPDELVSSRQDATLLTEYISRIRSRPGSPDEMLLTHIGCLFEVGSNELNKQLRTVIRMRSDGWQYAHSFDFTGMDISGADLQESNLLYARFHRTTASGVNLSKAICAGADFSHISDEAARESKRLASFNRADLSQSRWNSSNISASFVGADLYGADLRGGKIDPKQAKLDLSVSGALPYRPPSDEESETRRPARRKRGSVAVARKGKAGVQA